MKLDQETVVKHQFWFLLGGYFLIWFIAVMCLKFMAPEKIETFKKDYESKATGVKSALSSPVNTRTFLPPWEKETKEFSDHKGVIWGHAWKWQADMYDWPEEWRTKYDMTTPKAPLAPDDRNEYRDKLYLNQIANLRAYAPTMLRPVEFKGSFDEVFKPMTAADWKETPTREEIWLAQEDFWVKRELLWDVFNALAWQALMLPKDIEDKEPKPQGVEARYRFANKNWEITLNLRKSDKGLVIGGDSTIKNIHPSHHAQPLTSAKGKGIWFNVLQDNVRAMFEVRGEPVTWNEVRMFSAEKGGERRDYDPLTGINWTRMKDHPIRVAQGFDQSNSPIRRINAIELAKQDCRSAIWPLQPNHTLAELDPQEADASKSGAASPTGGAGMAGGAPTGGTAMPGAGGAAKDMYNKGGPSGMPGMPGMPGMGGAAQAGNKTPNNEIERNRYLQSSTLDKKANPPSRHLPLALQLIVEQTHMHNVLVSLANSRLRFQITQVEFRHVNDYVPQSEGDGKKDGADVAAGPGGRTFMGGTSGLYGGMQQQMQMQQRMQQQQQQQQYQRNAIMQQQMQQQMQMQRNMMSGRTGMGGAPAGMGNASYSRSPGMGQGGFATMPGKSASDKNAPAPQDDNLVELTVYGISTLYRSPDAPQTTEQGGQPGSPQPQAVQQPAAAPTAPPPSKTPTPPAAKEPNKAEDKQKAPPQTPKQSGKAEDNQKAPPPAPKEPNKADGKQKAPPPPTGGKS